MNSEIQQNSQLSSSKILQFNPLNRSKTRQTNRRIRQSSFAKRKAIYNGCRQKRWDLELGTNISKRGNFLTQEYWWLSSQKIHRPHKRDLRWLIKVINQACRESQKYNFVKGNRKSKIQMNYSSRWQKIHNETNNLQWQQYNCKIDFSSLN